MTALEEKYFDLYFTKKLHEFAKIDALEGFEPGQAKVKYNSLDNYFKEKLGRLDQSGLETLRAKFEPFRLAEKRNNIDRAELFKDHDKCMTWYDEQKNRCYYCKTTQEELRTIVNEKRDGNLTLNEGTKRSKGTLEIEKLDSNIGYTYKNCVLACPFCNNAKSNLISDTDWKKYFAEPMRNYIENQLK